MIYPAKKFEGYHIHAHDGVLGTVKDIYFDDEFWAVRYLVVATGSWLNGRQVLLPAAKLTADHAVARSFSIDATQDQVRNSPPIESDPPVSRQQEKALHDYFGWPYYWGVAPFASGAMGPIPPAPPDTALPPRASKEPEETEGRRGSAVETESRAQGDPHLRSIRETRHYAIEARDGSIGHVEDFLIDDDTWEIPHLIVDTRNWLPGRKVLLPPASILPVNWSASDLHVDLTREQIERAPGYVPGQPATADYTDRPHAHRSRPGGS